MIFIILSLVVIGLSLSGKAKANSTVEPIVKICDTCTFDYQFELEASSVFEGFVVVINPEKSIVKSYYRLDGYLTIDQENPPEAITAVTDYHNLKQEFSKYETGLVGTFAANGCGSPTSPWTYPFIPNYPFKNSCDSHDECYESGASKAVCDTVFLEDMLRQRADVGNSPLLTKYQQVLFKLLIGLQAQIYYEVVDRTEATYDAYCSVEINSQTDFCKMGFEAAEQMKDTGAPYGEPTTQDQYSAVHGITYSVTCQAYLVEWMAIPIAYEMKCWVTGVR